MPPFIDPLENTADILYNVGCLCDFLAEVLPCWLEQPDIDPPSRDAAQGLALLSHAIAEMVREASRRLPSDQMAA